MVTRIPSIKALRAFEAAARLGSMKDAADELYVTAGAVSRQIQALEEELGVMLFRRITRGLQLTAAGRAYAEELSALLQALTQATEQIRSRPTRSELRVLAPERFASLLVQVLKEFQLRHPRVELSISTFHGMDGAAEFRDGVGEVSIVWGDGQWPGLISHRLAPESHLVPLCAPDYLGGEEPLEAVEELARYPWLSNRHFPQGWRMWLQAVGAEDLQPRRLIELDNPRLLIAAARSGLGVVMWSSSGGLLDEPGQTGELVLAHRFRAPADPYTYYLTCPREAADDPVVESFRDCVLQAFGRLE